MEALRASLLAPAATIPSVEIEAHMLDDERLCDLAGETMPSTPIATRATILAPPGLWPRRG